MDLITISKVTSTSSIATSCLRPYRSWTRLHMQLSIAVSYALNEIYIVNMDRKVSEGFITGKALNKVNRDIRKRAIKYLTEKGRVVAQISSIVI